MSLFDSASLCITPNGVKESKLYAIKPTDGTGDLSVVRATTATRVNSAGLIESVALNVPRLDYTNSTCPSILVEPQRTNLVLRSEEFDNAVWTKTGSTITVNSTNSPNGTLTADKLIESSLSERHRVIQNANSSAGNVTASCYFKAGERAFSFLYLTTDSDVNKYTIVIDLANGTITNTNSVGSPIVVSATVANSGNGWYRAQITMTQGGGVVFIQAGPSNSATPIYANGVPSYLGNGTSGIYFWGAQLEAGSNATSYIPTTTATVTRNADVISKTGISSLIGQTEGTIFVDVNITNLLTTKNLITLDIGTTSQYLEFTLRSSSQFRLQLKNSLGLNTLFTSTTQSIGRKKIAITYKVGFYYIYLNGVLIGSSTFSGALPSVLSQLVLSDSNYGILNDSIKFAILFPTALTDTECIALTTL